ncbi:MAG: DEAD/DEAH box helicase [Patescibacteria group bacterium]
MKVFSINNLLRNYSTSWRRLWSVVENKKMSRIEDITADYWPCFIKCLLSGKRILIFSADQIILQRLSSSLDRWGLKNIVVPSSWSQLSQESLLTHSVFLDKFANNGGAMLVSSEEFFSDWSYQYSAGIQMHVGQKVSFINLTKQLIDIGLTRVKKVNGVGEFAIMGDIWLLKPIGDSCIWQINFDNDLLTAISQINDTGEVIEKKEINIPGQLVSSTKKASKLSLVAKYEYDYVVWLGFDLANDDYLDLANRIKDQKFMIMPRQIQLGCWGESREMSRVSWPVVAHSYILGGQENFAKNLERKRYKKNIVVTEHAKEFRRWVDELGLHYANFEIIDGFLPMGGVLADDGVAIWTDRELFGIKLKRLESAFSAKRISFKKLTEFKVGDLVVHSDHGVGLLKDFVTRDFAEQKKDYFVVAYSKGDLLYVPVEQLNKLSKYIGSKLVKISRLGGSLWYKRKTKAKKQVEQMAKELLRIYARRKLVRREPYLQKKQIVEIVSDEFGYDLTIDQKEAWRELQSDLDKPYPMDRLLCGDVGFGKTELALRVACRVAANDKQIAVLVPTTVLAEQHFVTFTNRLAKHSIRVDVLSRLKDVSYQKNVLKNVAAGKVDIVIGTHRILQSDVVFKDLGLLVIDEEQKFGVRAKEQLKKIRHSVDILSMSATPIPRTLNMSMGGMRDLSVLEIAPEGRQSINTQIVPYDDLVVKEAVEREIHRGGQVFIIHNRVRTIARLKDHLSEVFGLTKVKIGMAHGKMSEKELALSMNKFAKGEYDVLLATTIVENGLDLPNVNTLIVENAAGLGLSQLYQLRGRVGRSSRKAYAYFLYRSEKLKDKAKQRLEAISQAKELGGGMKLAVADMEIRGVGNVLGVQQHGNVYAVGLGVFLDMLSEMVERLKGQDVEETVADEQVAIDLPVSFCLPKYYIEDKEQRLLWEQKLSSSLSISDVDYLALKLRQGYGVWPLETENLIKIIKIRLLASKNGIKQIFCREKNTVLGDKEMNLILTFDKEISLDWVQYLFMQADGWIFRNNEVLIDIAKLQLKDWFDWFYKLLMNK